LRLPTSRFVGLKIKLNYKREGSFDFNLLNGVRLKPFPEAGIKALLPKF
jgi:hypothetical protein